MNPPSPRQTHVIRQLQRRSRIRCLAKWAVPCLAALGALAPQLQAGILYLDFANNGAPTTTGWTPFYVANIAGVTNVGGSGYTFSFPGVAAFGNSTTETLTGSGFHTNGSYAGRVFTLSGLNPSLPVKLYACAAWNAGRGAYLVYGDTGAAGKQAVTIGTPGTTGSLANMTLIGTATADASGVVSGSMYGRDGVPGTLEGQLGGFVFIPTQTVTASAGSNGTISQSGVTNVFAGDNQTYTITPESGYHVADVLVNGSTVGAVGSYAFTPVTRNSTISATFASDAAVSYTLTASAGANGSVSPSGITTVFEGVSQLYTIAPATGYHIADVLVDGVSVGAVPSYTFTGIGANHTLSASFAINTYTITASAGANGTVTPAGETTVNYGDTPSVTITPADGYYVASVLVDGVSVGAVTNYVFTPATANHTLSASFDNRTRIYLDFASNGAAVTNGWTGVFATQLANTALTSVSNIGGMGYGFTFANVAAYNTGDAANPLTTSGFYNYGNISPTSSPHLFTLTGLKPGQTASLYACAAWGGNATGGYLVYGNSGAAGVKAQTLGIPGTNPTLESLTLIGTAAADASGTVSGSLYGAGGVTAANEGQVGAFLFALNAPPSHTIAASAGANGTISPSGTATVTAGDSPVYTIAANSGYHVANVLVDEVSVGAVTEYTFTNVAADHTISATFDMDTITYTIQASAGDYGTISPTGNVSVFQGVTAPFTITPDTGCHIVDVLVDGISVGAVPSYTFTEVAANHSIKASFAINTYTVTASAGANGTIDPPGITTVSYDDSQSFTITPATGYFVVDVQVDGASVGAVTEYAFTNVMANHTISATFDNRSRVYLDFGQAGAGVTSGWTGVYATTAGVLDHDTMVNVANVGGSGFGFTVDHVSAWDNGNALQPLTRSGFFNFRDVDNTNTHGFTLTGLGAGRVVSLYACASWDGNGRGATIVFGNSGAAGVKAQTIDSPGLHPTQANLTLIGTATVDTTGVLTGSLHGADGVGTDSEGQVGGFLFVIEPAAPFVDTDGDAMDDNWELAYFGDLTATATGDFDQDGTDNLTEYRLGLFPNSGASRFAATPDANGTIHWPSVAGVTFTIERSATLATGSWLVLDPAVPGTAGTARFTDPEPPADSAFYRVRLNP